MENFAPSYVCSPAALPQALLQVPGAHGMVATGTRTASGRGLGMTGGARVTAPVPAEVQGTTVSIATREKTVVFLTATATALLPISDVVVDGVAGSRSWSPPV